MSGLTSHSFRRGAAQNANAGSKLSLSWILGRGGWCLTSVSKALNYVMNTTQEDQKVAKTLVGWSHNAQAQLAAVR